MCVTTVQPIIVEGYRSISETLAQMLQELEYQPGNNWMSIYLDDRVVYVPIPISSPSLEDNPPELEECDPE